MWHFNAPHFLQAIGFIASGALCDLLLFRLPFDVFFFGAAIGVNYNA